MKTIHYVLIAHELSGDSDLLFYHTEEEAQTKLSQFLGSIIRLDEVTIDKWDEPFCHCMLLHELADFNYCSVFIKIGLMIVDEKYDHYFANFTPCLDDSNFKLDTKANVELEVERWKSDYQDFEFTTITDEETNEVQIHFNIQYEDTWEGSEDTIRIGKVIYQ